VYATYYLHHDGTHGTDFPSWKEAPISYDYDPNDPVLSRGGRSLFIPAGSLDQRPVEPPYRDDVLVYTNEVLEEDVVKGSCLLLTFLKDP
jgi:predicted acyl esterase